MFSPYAPNYCVGMFESGFGGNLPTICPIGGKTRQLKPYFATAAGSKLAAADAIGPGPSSSSRNCLILAWIGSCTGSDPRALRSLYGYSFLTTRVAPLAQ